MRSQAAIMAAGEPLPLKAQSAAFAGETEAYNNAHSFVSGRLFLLNLETVQSEMQSRFLHWT